MNYVILYIGTLATFLVMDAIWLGYLGKGFYQSEIGFLLKENFNVFAAAAFYIFYAAGIIYFAINPYLEDRNFGKIVFSAFLLGLLAYGAYDFTNYATLKGFTFKVMIVDLIWGGIVTSTSAAGGFYTLKLFGKV